MHVQDSNDEALLAALRGGDEAALPALLTRHAPAILRFGMKMCRDRADAEDVLQDTLIAAARGLRDVRGSSALSTWFYTVARSFCIKRRRRAKHAPEGVDAIHDLEVPAPDALPDEAASRRELGAALEDAIRALDEKYREVLILRDVEGLSAPEVASVLGIGVDAVKSRLHRARASVRERLAPYVGASATEEGRAAACPDVVDMLSRHLEGEIGPDACASMERHVAGCTSCSSACTSLRQTLRVCRAAGEEGLSAEAKAKVRRAIEAAVRAGREA